METKVNPDNIQERAEKLSAAEVAPKTDEKVEAKPEVKVEEKTEIKPEVKTDKVEAKSNKVETKPEKTEIKSETKQPNDPAELRKWATKASQENAALRDEMKQIKEALAKLTKKEIDYKELAKNPDSIKAQIEAERQEAVATLQAELTEKSIEATKNATIIERMKREQDTTNYPEWKRLFPLIQKLANTQDGRINFAKADVGDVLDDLYQAALEDVRMYAPPADPIQKVEAQPVSQINPAPVGKSQEEIDALILAAEKRGYEKATAAVKSEQNGAGIGSAGIGGKRDSGVSKEAYAKMDMKDLKKLISRE